MARPRPSLDSDTDLLDRGVVPRRDRVRADPAVGRRQVHGKASGRDHALAVVSRSRVSIAESRR